MAVTLKIAESSRELNDVFALRHEVYAQECGRFGGPGNAPGYLVDQYDTHPYCANIIAYSEGEAVGTLRVNVDTGDGLPPDAHYDFGAFRLRAARECGDCENPRVGSAGMLAVRRQWRHRRDIILSLLKMGIGFGVQYGATHVIAVVNHVTWPMYERIGFEALDAPFYVEGIGDHVVPIAAPFAVLSHWALNDLLTETPFLQELSSAAHRVVLNQGEYLFTYGETAEACYVLDSGQLKITRADPVTGTELTLATLGRGDLFGELGLIDSGPRSANAVATSRTELVVIPRDAFMGQLKAQPEKAHELLQIFAQRLRRMDDLAFVLAYGSVQQRLEFAFSELRRLATEDGRFDGPVSIAAGPQDLARSAGVDESRARAFLEQKVAEEQCSFSDRKIRFQTPPTGFKAEEESA